MKTITLRLTLDVEFDPQGVSKTELIHNLHMVVRDAVNNGGLTCDSPATVEHYTASVKQLHS